MASVSVELPAPRPAGEGGAIEGVALVTIERPNVLNALDRATMLDLAARLEHLDADVGCRAIVIRGAGERAFAAGADIREMAGLGPEEVLASDHFAAWDRVAAVATPTIAAVRGYALGGGCELALACAIAIAGEDAVFGQPEVGLGIIPGVGGTQRLTRAVGKAVAMDVILSGRRLSAAEALAFGLVARVVPAEQVVPAALEVAERIASGAPLAVRAAREAVDAAMQLSLVDGVAEERRRFASLFGSEDQREGMAAFLEKRRPTWKGR